MSCSDFISQFPIFEYLLVTLTEDYSLLEEDIMVYDENESYQGEILGSEARLWPKTGNEVLIPYTKKAFYADVEKKEALKRAILEFHTKTCIR